MEEPDMAAVLNRATGHAVLEVCEHAVKAASQRGRVTGDRQHPDPEGSEDDEVDYSVDRDHPQHHSVAERLPTPGDLDRLALWRISASRMLGRSQRDPAVAAQAAQPANRAV